MPFLGRGANMAPPWTWTDSQRTALTVKAERQFSPDWKAALQYGWSRYQTKSLRAMVFNVPVDGSPTHVRLLGMDQHTTTHVASGKLEGQYRLLGRAHDLNLGFNLSQSVTTAPTNHYSTRGHATARWIHNQMIYTQPDYARLMQGGRPSEDRLAENGLYAATRLRATDAPSLLAGARLSYWKTRSLELRPYTVTDR